MGRCLLPVSEYFLFYDGFFNPLSRATELNLRGWGFHAAFEEKGDLSEGTGTSKGLPATLAEWVAFLQVHLGMPRQISGFSDLQPQLLTFSSLRVMLSIFLGMTLISSHSGTSLSCAKVL